MVWSQDGFWFGLGSVLIRPWFSVRCFWPGSDWILIRSCREGGCPRWERGRGKHSLALPSHDINNYRTSSCLCLRVVTMDGDWCWWCRCRVVSMLVFCRYRAFEIGFGAGVKTKRSTSTPLPPPPLCLRSGEPDSKHHKIPPQQLDSVFQDRYCMIEIMLPGGTRAVCLIYYGGP